MIPNLLGGVRRKHKSELTTLHPKEEKGKRNSLSDPIACLSLNPMACNDFPSNWEEDLENPIRDIEWVLNPLTGKHTVRSSTETANREYPLWCEIRKSVGYAMLSDNVFQRVL